MNKIMLSVISLMVAFAFTYAMPSQRVDALVVSKAASLTAKKVAKDFIKESAKEIAFEMAMQAISQTWDSKNDYKFEETHYGFCADVITPDGKCTRVLQVKKDLTPYDIENVDAQLDIEIDKAITSGSGMTKWQKFMDWFLPIWIVSFALTALTYAMDGNVRELFNEIAFNTLVALGLVKPAELLVEPPPEIVDKTTGEAIIKEANPTGTPSINYVNETISLEGLASMPLPSTSTLDTIIVTQFDHNLDVDTIPSITYSAKNADGSYPFVKTRFDSGSSTKIGTFYNNNGFTVTKDDNLLWTAPTTATPVVIPDTIVPNKRITTIIDRPYYVENNKHLAQTRVITEDGSEYVMTDTYPTVSFDRNKLITKYDVKVNGYDPNVPTASRGRSPTLETAIKQTVYTNATEVSYMPYNPLATDVLPNITVPKTKYEDEDGQVTLVPPVAIPLTQTSTGQKVTVSPNPIAGEEPILTNEDGQPVSDDDVTADDPDITESPEGVPQVTPPSTETNPNPVPIPLAPTTPPTDPPPPTESPPPEDGGGGKPNIPISLLLGLFKLLFAIIFYLIRMFTFIVTIQFIQPIPIPNPYFMWFTEATILGIQPYPLIKNIALFFLSFSIYKSIRRVFG